MMELPRTEDGRSIDIMLPHHLGEGGRGHYDHEGRQCTFGRWGELTEAKHDPNLRAAVGVPDDDSWWQIGFDTIGTVDVSTRWIGIPLGLMIVPGPPFIFETMIFGELTSSTYGRYCTRDDARAGHERCLKELQA
jgi:hypothetical protein